MERRRVSLAIRQACLPWKIKGDLMGMLCSRGPEVALKELGNVTRNVTDRLAAPSRPAETPTAWANRRQSATGLGPPYVGSRDQGGAWSLTLASGQTESRAAIKGSTMTKVLTYRPCPVCDGKGAINRHLGCHHCHGSATVQEAVDLKDTPEVRYLSGRVDHLEEGVQELLHAIREHANHGKLRTMEDLT